MVKPRRSLLYMPASNARALDKARALAADGFIFDLEDAVSPALKAEARTAAMAAVASGHYGRATIVVRVNGIGTMWHEADLAACAQARPDAVLVPKVSSVADVQSVVTKLPDTDIWCMIETPRAVLNVAEIAAAHPRMTCLVAGTSDLVKDLYAQEDTLRTASLFALSQMVCAARAAGIDVIDGVHAKIGDLDGLEAACRQGRLLGFSGKSLIHPEQIPIANAVFAPTAAQALQAEKIVAAYAQAGDKGVIVVDGQMIELLHVDMARRTLDIVKAING